MSNGVRMGKEMRRFVEISGYTRFTVSKICKAFAIDHRTATDEEMREATRRWVNRERKPTCVGREVAVDGRSMTLQQWAQVLEIPYQTLEARVWLRRSAELAIRESIEKPGLWKRGYVRREGDKRIRRYCVMGRSTSLGELSELTGISRDDISRFVRKLGEEEGVKRALERSGKLDAFLSMPSV